VNIRSLKTFCDIVDSGSLSKAARLNSVTQSAVSQQLARLEEELDVALIQRGGALAAPTGPGKVLYEGAKSIIHRYERMLGDVRSAKDTVRGVLRVGSIYSVGFYLLNPYVREFLRAHPEVDLRIEYAKWNNITAAVLSGELDLGLVAYPEKRRAIEILELGQEELVMVCSPEHRLADRREPISPKELKDERFIAFEKGMPTRRYIQKMLKARRVPVRIVREFDNIETLKRAIEVDTGLSILPRASVERDVADGYLSCVPFSDPAAWNRPIGVLRQRARPATQVEETFLDMIRKMQE